MSFLRWAGSKKQLLDVLSSCWYASQNVDPSGRYIEAFSGSAALFFTLRPNNAILVDKNADLQECMEQVRRAPLKVAALLPKFRATAEDYYHARSLDIRQLTAIERAARFIYLNRFCFNGLYRTNQQGKFNVPFGGSSKSGALPPEPQLLAAAEALQRATLLTADFADALHDQIAAGDFLYMDPPYAKANERLRHQYGPDVFGTQDIERLVNLAEVAHERGAHFVVSYAKCPEIADFANAWHSHEVTVRRNIAANALQRAPATELLITNI